MTKTIRTVKYTRGPIGTIVKWLFIIFNLLMTLWLFSYWGDIAPMMSEGSGAEKAGAAIGSTIGTGMILMIWVLGTVVLGIPVLLTKGSRVEIEEASVDSSQTIITPHTSDDNWITKFKTGFEVLVRYAVFIICFMIGLSLLSSDSTIFGMGFTALGLMFLPQIKTAMAEKKLSKPAMKILAAVGIITLLTYIGTSDSPSSNIADRKEKAEQTQTKQKNLQEETEKTFAENPDKVLQEILTHAANNNWQIVKAKTKLLLGTQHPEINRLHNEAVAELKKAEEQKLKHQQEVLARQAEEAAAALWSYSQNDDPMSNGKTYHAYISSSNTVQFDFPYSGAQHGTLTLRTHPKHGKDVIFSIERGQILCPSYDSCAVQVRFDDENATSYTAVGAADNSTETIFIQNYSAFVGKMIKAKRVRISMNIYQEGAPVFDFDVSGFNVDKYKPKN